MFKYCLFFTLAALFSLLITPLIQKLARRFKIMDLPSDRKIHKTPVPLLGGVSIFIGFNAALFLGYLLKNEFLTNFIRTKGLLIIIPEIIILVIGIYDDIKRVKALHKFLFQIMAGSLAVVFGFGIHIIKNPFSNNIVYLGAWSIPLTILWVVGITNALNLIDGLDGLAAGISFIACFTIFGISYIYQNIDTAIVSLTLAGSILGFLKYNFYPAKIFLGDSGSLLLGFLLSILSVDGAHKGAVVIAVLAPLLALGLPIMDTFLSMARRFLKTVRLGGSREERAGGRTPFLKKFPIFTADNDHIHHRLLKLGLSHRKAVFLLYGICVLLCVLALITVARQNLNITIFIIAILAASIIGVRSLRYHEFRVFQRELFLNLFDLPFIGKTYFQVFVDLLFIFIAYYLTSIISQGSLVDASVKSAFIETFPLVLIVKIAVFYVSGLYKGMWRYAGVEHLLKIVRAVTLSSAMMPVALALYPSHLSSPKVSFYLLDYYFLLTMVGGFRIAYKVLDDYKRNNHQGEKILIYGAGRKGDLAANELIYLSSSPPQIVGFIDDDPALIGDTQNGIPVLGSFDDLENLIREHSITEIYVSDEGLLKERKSALKTVCTVNAVELRLFKMSIYPVK